ncbi:MAG: sugar transferase [Planctomycetes bacterium]|nr:sugar transferase [Planctomycetota bacterium]
MKRLFDAAASALGLLVLSPLLAAIAVWIKLDSPGPVFYRGRRIGRGGRPFLMYKFRTMIVNADRLGGPSTPLEDARITRAGRFLRKRKLDELPQLLNVLVGEMSLVGPRPEVEEYVRLFTEEERQILQARPGITDWASLWNPDEGRVLAGSPDPERTYLEVIRPGKLRLQLEYVRRRTFWTDMGILFQTLTVTLLGTKPKMAGPLEQKGATCR